MILNNAQNVKRGNIQTQYVYHGSILIWPPGPPPEPPIDPDKYEADHSDAITIVRLDSSNAETTDIFYTQYFDNAMAYLKEKYDENSDTLFNLYYGDSVAYPSESSWNSEMGTYLNRNYKPKNRNNIRMFRFKKVGPAYRLSAPSSAGYADAGMTRLKVVIMPESAGGYYYVRQAFLAYSGVDNVIFRGDTIYRVEQAAFYQCKSLKSIEMPKITYAGTTASNSGIGMNAFYGCSDISIKLHNSANSIPGAPWGATNANITWW